MTAVLQLGAPGEVPPGGTSTVSVTIHNAGVVVESYALEVLGDPAAWASVDPPVVNLLPGESATATVTFVVPAAADVVAGARPFAVRAAAVSDPASSAVEESTLEVLGRTAVTGRLVPRTAQGRGRSRHRVELENAGNAAAEVHLHGSDPDEALRVSVDPPVVVVPAGGAAEAAVRVRSRRRGRARLPFTVEAADGAGWTASFDGALDQQGMPKALLLAPVAVAAVVLAAFLVRPDGPMSATRVLEPDGDDDATTTTMGGGPGSSVAISTPDADPGGSTTIRREDSVPDGRGTTTSRGATTSTTRAPTTTTTPPVTGTRPHDTVDLYASWNGSTVDATSSHNPGGAPVVTSSATGVYRVRLPGAALGDGNVQATAQGDTTARCNVGGWNGDGVDISCFSQGGAPTNGPFTLLFTRRTDAVYAWVRADGTAPPTYARGVASASSVGGGAYRVATSAALAGGTVQVTPYGSAERCSVQGWSGTTIDVRCSAPTAFTVLHRTGAGASAPAYAWSRSGSGGDVPDGYRNNPAGGAVTVARTAPGAYTVTFAGADYRPGGTAKATPYGATPASCAIVARGREQVRVRCTADTPFTLLYL